MRQLSIWWSAWTRRRLTKTPPRPVLRSRLYEQVADQISTWIIENGRPAGDRLPPSVMAERLGVSGATLSEVWSPRGDSAWGRSGTATARC